MDSSGLRSYQWTYSGRNYDHANIRRALDITSTLEMARQTLLNLRPLHGVAKNL